MTSPAPDIEALGDHEYLVHIPLDDEVITIRMVADPELVADISGAVGNEARVVSATVDFLMVRQRADELPPDLDLQDVVSAYRGYVDELRSKFAEPQ